LTLQEIKAAIEAGKTVHWASEGYVVVKGKHEQWFILFPSNGHCIGLTWQDGITLNGRPDEFFIAG
jgi:hypothetical protein